MSETAYLDFGGFLHREVQSRTTRAGGEYKLIPGWVIRARADTNPGSELLDIRLPPLTLRHEHGDQGA